MAYCEQYIADKYGKMVVSSPRFRQSIERCFNCERTYKINQEKQEEIDMFEIKINKDFLIGSSRCNDF